MNSRPARAQDAGMQHVAVHLNSPLPTDGVPEWVHLIPAGVIRTVDGRGPWHMENPDALIANSMADGPLVIDENHSTDIAAPQGQPSPARAQIVELQSRADGIWGRVEWNEAGRELLAQRAYRFLSPVINVEKKSGAVLRLLRAALTNTPNLTQLTALNSQSEQTMDLALLRQALGLPETADEAACLAAAQTAHAERTQLNAALAAIAAASGAPAGATTEVVLNAVRARAVAATQEATLAATVQRQETELNTLRATGARERAVALVDAAIKAGKPVVALRDRYIERACADHDGVAAELNALPSINAGGVATVVNAAGIPASDDALTEDERNVAARMGVDPVKFLENKKKLAASRQGMEA